MNSTIKRNVKQTRKFPAGNPSLPSKRLSIWDSTFTGNANWDARFIASYGRRASRRAVGVDFAPGARAPDPLPHHEPRPRETEGRRSIPLPAIALRSPSGGGGGGVVVGGCGGFPTTIIAGAYAGRGFRGTNVKSVSAVQVSPRVQGGEPWDVGF